VTDTARSCPAVLALVLLAALGACGGSESPRVAPPAEVGDPSPRPTASPQALAFTTTTGVTPAPQVITVSDAADGTFGIPTATSDVSFFAVTVEGAAPPYSVTVRADAVQAEGSFAGTVTVSVPGAAGGPLSIPLTLVVLQPLPQAATVACHAAGATMCLTFSSTCGPMVSAFEADCAASGGEPACPTAGKVGGCVLPGQAGEYTHWYYAPEFTAAMGEGICTTGLGGTWTAP
jgi:hypothetical protein